jgi:hypothetical protein
MKVSNVGFSLKFIFLNVVGRSEYEGKESLLASKDCRGESLLGVSQASHFALV